MHRLYLVFAVFAAVGFIFTPSITADPKSVEELEIAFARDGFNVIKIVSFQGKNGLLAEHREAVNYETQKPKRVLYVEGNGYQMGYLIGLLAYEDVERMSTDFVDNILFDFINVDVDPKKIPIIWGIMKSIIVEASQKVLVDIPQVYLDELNGLVDGCKAVNPESKVVFDDLLVLNVGFDCLLSVFYAINGTWEKKPALSPRDINIPIMCNAFSVFGEATRNGKHYFGRDFMFPTANIFQHTACLTIYNPDDGRIPQVASSAPGFVGAIANMNREGVGMGVDMSPSGNCDHRRPGLNSLLMVRHAIDNGSSAEHALRMVIDAQRGVSWDYLIADGKNDRSVAVEGGHTTMELKFDQFPPEELRWMNLVPDKAWLERLENQKHQKGIMVRWNDYQYPQEFLKFNNDLFGYYEKKINNKAWGERGFINTNLKENNCPKAFYFAPQRENRDDVLIVTNHFISPSMRMAAMNPWTTVVSEHKYDDIQWRYDVLNDEILRSYGRIDEQKAIELIDFLAPSGNFPDYYKNAKTSSDKKTKVIGGTVSLFNLSDRVVHSHFGYYADKWITISLDNYVN